MALPRREVSPVPPGTEACPGSELRPSPATAIPALRGRRCTGERSIAPTAGEQELGGKREPIEGKRERVGGNCSPIS